MNWTKCPVDLLVRISTETWEKPICQPFVLHLAATALSRDRGTEGFVPSAALDTLAPWSQDGPTTKEVAESLVKCGRWVPCDGGYSLADWEFQRVPQAISEARAEAGRLGGLRSGESRRSKQNEAVASEVKQTKQNEVEERRGDEMRGEEKKEPAAPGSASPTPKSRKKPTPHPNRQPLMEAIDAIHEEALGFKIDWSLGKNRGIADRLARRYEIPDVEARARRFWIDHLPSFVWEGKLTTPCLSDFMAHFERLAEAKHNTNGHYPIGFVPYNPEDFQL